MTRADIRAAAVEGLRQEPEVDRLRRFAAMMEGMRNEIPFPVNSERKWTVLEYIMEEVRRQGHDLAVWSDGGIRVVNMGRAWQLAASRPVEFMCSEMICGLGRLIEPEKNALGFRTVNVRVGNHACPPHEEVIPRLEDLLTKLRRQGMEPLDFYREFEGVHPFVDGNGRTGKCILNWLNGTLGSPIFPPADFWGYPLRNP
jgi:hypothetical protein